MLTQSSAIMYDLSMIELQPKTLWQQNEDSRKAWRTMVDSTTFQTAISFALADYSLNRSPSEAQLDGALGFIDVLLNFAEAPEKPPALPIKRLTVGDPALYRERHNK